MDSVHVNRETREADQVFSNGISSSVYTRKERAAVHANITKRQTSAPSADDQCIQELGAGSRFCPGSYPAVFPELEDFSIMCTTAICLKPGTSTCQEVGQLFVNFTTCGNQKWCIGGVCVFDVAAPVTSSDLCPQGDSTGQACNLTPTQCEFLRNNVLRVFLDCCETCAEETTTPTTTTSTTTPTTTTSTTTPTTTTSTTTPTTTTSTTTPTTTTSTTTPTTTTSTTTPTTTASTTTPSTTGSTTTPTTTTSTTTPATTASTTTPTTTASTTTPTTTASTTTPTTTASTTTPTTTTASTTTPTTTTSTTTPTTTASTTTPTTTTSTTTPATTASTTTPTTTTSPTTPATTTMQRCTVFRYLKSKCSNPPIAKCRYMLSKSGCRHPKRRKLQRFCYLLRNRDKK
ncbi:hypothetical protein SNE40_006286 [Patella caerulea]|uniref:ADAMTS cysteine-rich domain-containing protein n=1 Tax=Patella caerulea TaxID=87958 RepID=A0AAN8K024_PATCE